MKRAPFQVLVVPFIRHQDGGIKYALLRRDAVTGGYFQFVAGGGEIGETPIQAARREASEEIGSDVRSALVALDALTMIPVKDVCGFVWGPNVLVIPEHCFGIELQSESLTLSHEHSEYAWHSYDEAISMVNWESNKIALWEIHHRLTNNLIKMAD